MFRLAHFVAHDLVSSTFLPMSRLICFPYSLLLPRCNDCFLSHTSYLDIL